MFPLKVLQEAKKHKKLFEKYWVHPFYLHLNSTDFYLIFFTRFYSKKSELIVSATTNEADQADYNRALEYLVFLLNNGASIVDNGNSRKKINMVGFEKTKAFLKEVLDRNVLNEDIKPYYENTYNILTINLNLQKELINLVDQYDSFINKKRDEDNNRFFPEDVDFVQSILAQLDYIQYKQLGNSIKGFDDFSYINEDLNTNSRVQEYVTPEVKGYIKEFSKDKEILHQEIKKITYFKDQDKLTKEEHIDKVKERYNEMQRTYLQGLKEDIRNLD